MKFDTNKDKGNAGLAMAIAYFGSNGYTVSVPLNDTQDYDLVVEKDGIFQSVQCKATGYKKNEDSYELTLKSCGGTKGEVYKRVVDTDVDLIFALREDGVMYLIPKKDITNTATVNLTTKKSVHAPSKSFDSSKYIIHI